MRFLDKLTETDLKTQRKYFLNNASIYLGRKFSETSFSVSNIVMNTYEDITNRTGIVSTGEMYITGESAAFKFTVKVNLISKYMTLTKNKKVEDSYYGQVKVEFEVTTLEAFDLDKTPIKLDKKSIKSFESLLLRSKKYNAVKTEIRLKSEKEIRKLSKTVKGYDKIHKLVKQEQQEIDIEKASKEAKLMNDKETLAFKYKVEVFNLAYDNDEQFVIFDKPLRPQATKEATSLIKSYDASAWAIDSFFQQKDVVEKNKQILQALKKLGTGKIYTISSGPQGTLSSNNL